jgi:hypothetical protein
MYTSTLEGFRDYSGLVTAVWHIDGLKANWSVEWNVDAYNVGSEAIRAAVTSFILLLISGVWRRAAW